MIDIYRKAIFKACEKASIPVYDYWVIDKPYPYIIISEVNLDEEDLKLNIRQDYSFTISVFDKGKGKTSVVNYIDMIKNTLKNIDGVRVKIAVRYFSDVEPNVNHGLMTIAFTKFY